MRLLALGNGISEISHPFCPLDRVLIFFLVYPTATTWVNEKYLTTTAASHAGEGVVEAPVDQTNLTERYTQECIRF